VFLKFRFVGCSLAVYSLPLVAPLFKIESFLNQIMFKELSERMFQYVAYITVNYEIWLLRTATSTSATKWYPHKKISFVWAFYGMKAFESLEVQYRSAYCGINLANQCFLVGRSLLRAIATNLPELTPRRFYSVLLFRPISVPPPPTTTEELKTRITETCETNNHYIP
jgi:hypothetical protein